MQKYKFNNLRIDMSVITTFKIEDKILNLKNNIKKLESLNELLSFQIIIYDSIKLFSSISQLIKNKNNIIKKYYKRITNKYHLFFTM